MNTENVTSIDVNSLRAVVRPCSMVTVTSPISGKEHLQ